MSAILGGMGSLDTPEYSCGTKSGMSLFAFSRKVYDGKWPMSENMFLLSGTFSYGDMRGKHGRIKATQQRKNYTTELQDDANR